MKPGHDGATAGRRGVRVQPAGKAAAPTSFDVNAAGARRRRRRRRAGAACGDVRRDGTAGTGRRGRPTPRRVRPCWRPDDGRRRRRRCRRRCGATPAAAGRWRLDDRGRCRRQRGRGATTACRDSRGDGGVKLERLRVIQGAESCARLGLVALDVGFEFHGARVMLAQRSVTGPADVRAAGSGLQTGSCGRRGSVQVEEADRGGRIPKGPPEKSRQATPERPARGPDRSRRRSRTVRCGVRSAASRSGLSRCAFPPSASRAECRGSRSRSAPRQSPSAPRQSRP